MRNFKIQALVGLVVCLLFFTQEVFSQTKHHINGKGEIHNEGGVKMGHIDTNGVIYNAQGKKLGNVDSLGMVYDAGEKKIGQIKNHQFYSLDGKAVILTKHDSGDKYQYTNEHGKLLGTSDADYKHHAPAVHYLMQKGEKKKKK